MPAGVSDKSQKPDNKKSVGLHKRLQNAIVQESIKPGHNYVLKCVSIIFIAAVIMFASNSNFSRMIGIFTLYIGLAFDLSGLDFSPIQNEKRLPAIALYICFVYAIIAISIVILIIIAQNHAFLTLCRQHSSFCYCLMFFTALSSAFSPALELILSVAQEEVPGQEKEESHDS